MIVKDTKPDCGPGSLSALDKEKWQNCDVFTWNDSIAPSVTFTKSYNKFKEVKIQGLQTQDVKYALLNNTITFSLSCSGVHLCSLNGMSYQ